MADTKLQWIYRRFASAGTLWFETTCGDASNAESLLFTDPVEILTLSFTDNPEEFFRKLEHRLAQGYSLAGWMSYEAGYLLEHVFSGSSVAGETASTLAWFGVYEKPERFAVGEFGLSDPYPAPEPFLLSNIAYDLTETEYLEHILLLKRDIEEGNVYQVNFTSLYRFDFQGSAAGLYHAMKLRQPSAYTAFLNTGDRMVLSFSPELFFRRQGSIVETMPMKGTAPRAESVRSDLDHRERLGRCEKNLAENLMIVDLLRNDLGRICKKGTIDAAPLFIVQSYPTLHQMVSSVRGTLNDGVGLYELFRALYPSGSVTGAPKIRSMEIIRALEKSQRGIYTGAIGFMLPDSRMVFSVPIRTIELFGHRGVYGSGSGIVWDSDPHEEYQECRLKAKILYGSEDKGIELFETILWHDLYLWLDDHLERMAESAEALGYQYDGDAAVRMLGRLEQHSFRKGILYRVRLKLDRSGGISVEYEPFSHVTVEMPVRVCLAGEVISSANPALHHKTTDRGIYDRYYREALGRGYQEVLFMNECGEVTEGAISNIIIRKGNRYLTPPLDCGLLDGIFRRYYLRTRPWVTESSMTAEDIRHADLLLLCNAVRGLRPAQLHEETIYCNG